MSVSPASSTSSISSISSTPATPSAVAQSVPSARSISPALHVRALAELVGVYALVTAGCGAIIVDAQTGALTHVGVALTFGAIITVMIAATGHLSGAHFNPAVTLAFALTRHFSWRDVPAYVLGQVGGALAGALTLRLLFGPVAYLGATTPRGSAFQAFALEILLTAVLMFVITAVATDTRAVGQLAAITIGATVALDALWGGPISGASMNPARSFGPALVAGVWQDQWVYWLGPVLGACAGALLYQYLRTQRVNGSQGSQGRSTAPDSPPPEAREVQTDH